MEYGLVIYPSRKATPLIMPGFPFPKDGLIKRKTLQFARPKKVYWQSRHVISTDPLCTCTVPETKADYYACVHCPCIADAHVVDDQSLFILIYKRISWWLMSKAREGAAKINEFIFSLLLDKIKNAEMIYVWILLILRNLTIVCSTLGMFL